MRSRRSFVALIFLAHGCRIHCLPVWSSGFAYAPARRTSIRSRGVVGFHRQALQVAETFAVFICLPVIAWLGIPWIWEFFQRTRSKQWFVALLLGKRVYLCLLATLAAAYAGKRAAIGLERPLGERFQALNEEILEQKSSEFSIAPRVPSNDFSEATKIAPTSSVAEEPDSSTAENFKTGSSPTQGIYSKLDQVEGSTQALTISLLLLVSLAVSFLFVQNTGMQIASLPKGLDISILKAQIDALVFLSNAAVVTLFTATESRAIARGLWRTATGSELPQSAQVVANFFAAAMAAMAFWLPLGNIWPVQNIVNISIVVTVTRALVQSEFRTIALLLAAVAFYDFLGVFATAVLLGGGGAMGTVAMSKAGGGGAAASTAAGAAATGSSVGALAAPASLPLPAWRPGLLEVVVAGSVSDALGLADVIFPAVLMAWAAKRDAQKSSSGASYFGSCVLGFLLGFLACEFAPVIGQAALVLIVPFMLASVSVAAWKRDELADIWFHDGKRL